MRCSSLTRLKIKTREFLLNSRKLIGEISEYKVIKEMSLESLGPIVFLRADRGCKYYAVAKSEENICIDQKPRGMRFLL